MTAQDAIGAALSTTKHWRLFAPYAPLERFIAQALLSARADAFEACGWNHAAAVCRKTSEGVGEIDIPDGTLAILVSRGPRA